MCGFLSLFVRIFLFLFLFLFFLFFFVFSCLWEVIFFFSLQDNLSFFERIFFSCLCAKLLFIVFCEFVFLCLSCEWVGQWKRSLCVLKKPFLTIFS